MLPPPRPPSRSRPDRHTEGIVLIWVLVLGVVLAAIMAFSLTSGKTRAFSGKLAITDSADQRLLGSTASFTQRLLTVHANDLANAAQSPATPGGDGYAGSGTTDAPGGGLNIDGIAASLENFGSGGITGMFPAISGGIALLQGASSFIGMIPGLGGIADAINKFLDFASGANASIAPIMAVAKTVGHYMRLVAGGQKTLEGLFNVRSLDDATNAINDLTGLAGQSGLIDPNALKSDPAAAATQIAQTFDAQIQATLAQRRHYAGSPAIQAAIDARISRLKDLRAISMRKVNSQARVKDIIKNDRSAAELASSTAESAMTLTTAAATVTNPKDAAKINVAATTQVANAVASGLANVSDQLTQQAALTVGTNESLDQLVQQSVAQETAKQVKYEVDLKNDDLQAQEKFRATQQIGMVTTNALAHTLTPKSEDDLNFGEILRTKR